MVPRKGLMTCAWCEMAHIGGAKLKVGSASLTDRPSLSYDFSHFRLGLPRPTDPPREARWEKHWPFWVGTPLSPRPAGPLLPQWAGRELFFSLLGRFLPFFSDFDPDRPTHLGPDLGRRAHFQLRTPTSLSICSMARLKTRSRTPRLHAREISFEEDARLQAVERLR